MKLDKFFALAAYAVQALATLALVFAVSRVLSGAEYGHYSLVVASAQSAAVLAFEWVRLAASRFCVNVQSSDESERKNTVQSAFIMAALVLGVVGVACVFGGLLSWAQLSLGVAIAVLIGITDLLLVFLRVQGSFNQFAVLQMLRAFSLLGASVGGAYWGGTASSALWGLCGGYLLSLGVYVLAAPKWWLWNPKRVQADLFKSMAAYGVSVAAAANIHLQVPLLLRWVGKSFLSPEGFAGLSLAMDILQKPFSLVLSAIGGVLNPGVIVEYEEGKAPASPKLRQIYEVQVWVVFVILGGAIAFLPDVVEFLVKSEIRTWVVNFGPSVAVLFAFHALIQSTIAIPGHLLHKGGRLIGNAVVELAAVSICVVGAVYFDALRPYLWMWLGVVAVFGSMLYALPLIRLVPCELPVAAVVFASMVAAALAALYWLPSPSSIGFLVSKVLLAVLICGGGGWFYLRRAYRTPAIL